MNLAWLAQVVFYTFYFIAWLTKELPQTTFVTITAIAAVVIAVLLVIGNYATLTTRTPAA